MSAFFEKLKTVNKDNLRPFNYPGVWALFGKRVCVENDNKWYCLQVGETNCIANEIQKDMQLLDSELDEKEREVFYVNQFGEELFSYYTHPSTREYLYSKYIKEQFRDFQFVVICEEKDIVVRKSIEKEFAYRTNAIYWRNGRAFKNGKKIDYRNRKSIIQDIPYNEIVSDEVIIPFVERYNNQ